MAAGALWTMWTINKGAFDGDQVVFYMLKPLSAFVAAGIVEDAPRLEDDESYGWYGHYMTDISGVQMLPRFVPISEARTRFPQWGWFANPDKAHWFPVISPTNCWASCERARLHLRPPENPTSKARKPRLSSPKPRGAVDFVISLSKRPRVSAMSASAISPRF